MSTRKGALILIGMAAFATNGNSAVVVGGTEWRQLTETIGFTWNEVATACPQDGVACSGSIIRATDGATVDVTGWIWARNADLQALFDAIIQPGTINFGSEFGAYSKIDDPDIQRTLSGACWFVPTQITPAYGDYYRYLHGWSAATYGTSNAYVPNIKDISAGQFDTAQLNTIQSRANRTYQGTAPLGVWLHRSLSALSRTPEVIVLTDVNSDGFDDLAVIRDQPIRAEIRSGQDGALLKTMQFFDDSVTPQTTELLPDSDGNGVAEVAVLAARKSDGRGVVEIRNVAGAEAARQIWFEACHRPLAMAVIKGDADNNGVAELAVLSIRDSDGRGLVEVKNAFGATNPKSIWVGAGLTPVKLEIVDDADKNGVPEVAVLATRASDGRVLVEVKNAAGATNPNSLWFMAGNTAVDLTVVSDADGNTIPEVAVLSKRNSDGRIVVEVKNAAGTANPNAVWFAAGHSGVAVSSLVDADGNGVPELAVLSNRNSDGRIVVEVKNADGATNPSALWYPPGLSARDLAILHDLDSNGIEEAAPLLVRDSDGRILVQSRNASGSQLPKDYWFSP